MLKIVTVIGARPQIIKAAAISRAIANKFREKISEVIVHTGQHYDENMSEVFFRELGIPAPHYNLGTGSASHGRQTASMIVGIEEILEKEKPAGIILYGDTNSTLAGAIAASKMHIPVVHIEAGLRSFNKAMPEEINRIVCDHVSTLLFSPTATGFQNLLDEGFNANNKGPYNADNPRIYHCGDIMYDNSLHFSSITEKNSSIISSLGLEKEQFILCTIHRNNNTDEPDRLSSIFEALDEITRTKGQRVILPLHPRTAKLMGTNLPAALFEKISSNKRIRIIPPASFLDMVSLEKACAMVMTDSGGVQKEAFYFNKPCVILRSETEWTELVECGAAIIADADKQRILAAYATLSEKKDLEFPSYYGDGHAAEFICGEIVANLSPVRTSDN